MTLHTKLHEIIKNKKYFDKKINSYSRSIYHMQFFINMIYKKHFPLYIDLGIREDIWPLDSF